MNWIELGARFLVDCGTQLLPLFSGMVHIAMGAFIYHMGVKFGGGK